MGGLVHLHVLAVGQKPGMLATAVVVQGGYGLIGPKEGLSSFKPQWKMPPTLELGGVTPRLCQDAGHGRQVGRLPTVACTHHGYLSVREPIRICCPRHQEGQDLEELDGRARVSNMVWVPQAKQDCASGVRNHQMPPVERLYNSTASGRHQDRRRY